MSKTTEYCEGDFDYEYESESDTKIKLMRLRSVIVSSTTSGGIKWISGPYERERKSVAVILDRLSKRIGLPDNFINLLLL